MNRLRLDAAAIAPTERDQDAPDSAHAARDHDLGAVVNRAALEFSRGIPERSARDVEQTARERLELAEQRDAIAHLRDRAAMARDQAADARDVAMSRLDAASAQYDASHALTGVELVNRAADQCRCAAQHRTQAANQRVLAAADRQAAARDREFAAQERQQAFSDRQALADEVDRAAVDGLTSARTRAAGLRELDNELDRARRTVTPLVVAYLDVVGLKDVNDRLGHAAGDALLRGIVVSIKAHVRPYDLVIRVGGDEFLCVMSNLTGEDARERFRAIAVTINQAPQAGEITVGFAELRDGESAEDLIARADSGLIRSRHRSRGSQRPNPEIHA